MKPEDKALELIMKYRKIVHANKTQELWVKKTTECALVAVEEIIFQYKQERFARYFNNNSIEYWELVEKNLKELNYETDLPTY